MCHAQVNGCSYSLAMHKLMDSNIRLIAMHKLMDAVIVMTDSVIAMHKSMDAVIRLRGCTDFKV